MQEAARERFKGYISCGTVEIRELDLRRECPPVQASVTLSILTLQFTPIEYRQRIVEAGAENVIMAPADFAAFEAAEIDRWREVVRISGAKID